MFRIDRMSLTLLCLLLQSVCAAEETQRPNVLFVVTDDQRWDTIAALGNDEIQTPTLDQLANRGFIFNNAYCMGSMRGAVCIPSRCMLMTGKSLWRIPEWRAKTYDGPTLGKSFRQAGYGTLYCGKQNTSFVAGNHDFETVIFDNSRTSHPEERIPSSGFMADSVVSWLSNRNRERPFCIYLGPPVPHDPRIAPKQFMEMYNPDELTLAKNFLPMHPFDNGELHGRDESLAPHPRTREVMQRHLADYYAAITCFDYHLGRIIDAIKQQDAWNNTIVVFTSDHGLAVGGRHGLMGKQNLYESNKPPLIFAGPGIPRGESDALVYLFDLYPTVCAAAGIPAPQGIEGQNLMPIIEGNSDHVRATVFCAYREFQRMIRDNRWKLIRYHVNGERHTQLFDLKDDPYETRNLAGDRAYAEQQSRLESLLTKARESYGDPVDFDAEVPAPSVNQ